MSTSSRSSQTSDAPRRFHCGAPSRARRCASRWAALALTMALAAAVTPTARAQELRVTHEPSAQQVRRDWTARIALGLAGAASGFVMHEMGHVLANFMLGNVPQFRGTRVWGFIPFVVVRPGISCDGERCTKRNGERFRPGLRGYYFIVTSGFHVQELTDEVILTRFPNLRAQRDPFRKGLLAFNVLLSVGYALGAFTGLEDEHGDLAGAGRRSGFDSRWLALVLLAPAGLDIYRYFDPSKRWTPWASRVSKGVMFGLNFAF